MSPNIDKPEGDSPLLHLRRRVMGLLRPLHVSIDGPEQPFFLDVRTAGRLLGASHTQASRWLFLLESDGIIKTICKGGTAKTARKATRFKY